MAHTACLPAPARRRGSIEVVRHAGTVATRVRTVEGRTSRLREDRLATEEPLEIRVRPAGGTARPAAATMRTPGHDFELAAGLLHAEGVLAGRDALARIRYCTDPDVDGAQQYNVVTVDLVSADEPRLAGLERALPPTSACGICGLASIDELLSRGLEPLDQPPAPVVDAELLTTLPGRLREEQRRFEETGGVHAAGLFDTAGEPTCVREDVGRHNAVDKVVGWALLEHRLPLADQVLMVSGRASFEIVQKAVIARIPILAAVSAPSSLAVETARRFGLTLAGFLRGDRFNVYSGEERIRL
jgi:FdhD protein